MTEVERAVEAVRAGELVVLPTDTVYGLACDPGRPDAVRRLSELKGRSSDQPIALLAASVDVLLDRLPELAARERTLRTLLPGPLTLVLANPAGRFPWLAGNRPETIGVRVPEVAGPGRDVLAGVGVLAATSANPHGEPDARSLQEVPPGIRDSVAAAVDGGELPGVPSTVVDLTGPEPRVVRVGAVSEEEALARVAAGGE